MISDKFERFHKDLKDYEEGYLKGSKEQTDPVLWSCSPEFILGFTRGLGDFKRGEVDLIFAMQNTKKRLETHYNIWPEYYV